MLRLTTKATEHLLRVRGEKGLGDSSNPRFVRRSGRLTLTFAPTPENGDRVVDGEQVSTLVAESASDLLDDATIDVESSSGKAFLVVRRPRKRGRTTATQRGSAARAGA